MADDQNMRYSKIKTGEFKAAEPPQEYVGILFIYQRGARGAEPLEMQGGLEGRSRPPRIQYSICFYQISIFVYLFAKTYQNCNSPK